MPQTLHASDADLAVCDSLPLAEQLRDRMRDRAKATAILGPVFYQVHPMSLLLELPK